MITDRLTPVLSTPYWELFHEAPGGVVLLRRLALRAESPQHLKDQNETVKLQLRATRPRLGIVVDVREAPPPTEGIDAAMLPLREATYRLFQRVAVLFGSQVGVLHLKRLGYPEGAQVLATTDEREAFAFARAASEP